MIYIIDIMQFLFNSPAATESIPIATSVQISTFLLATSTPSADVISLAPTTSAVTTSTPAADVISLAPTTSVALSVTTTVLQDHTTTTVVNTSPLHQGKRADTVNKIN